MAEAVSAGVGAEVRLHCGACPWVASTLDWETGALRAVEDEAGHSAWLDAVLPPEEDLGAVAAGHRCEQCEGALVWSITRGPETAPLPSQTVGALAEREADVEHLLTQAEALGVPPDTRPAWPDAPWIDALAARIDGAIDAQISAVVHEADPAKAAATKLRCRPTDRAQPDAAGRKGHTA